MNENIYKNMMNQAKPSNMLIQETKRKMYVFAEDESVTHCAPRRRLKLAPLLVAAILSVSLAITALAFGEELLTLVFGNSTVKQVEFEESFVSINENEDYITIYTRTPSDTPCGDIKNRCVPNLDWTWAEAESWGSFEMYPTESYSSFDELSHAAPFAVKEPSYMPDGWELSQAELFLYRDGTYSYDAWIYYRNSGEFVPFILFAQYYAGADAYFDVLMTSDYEHERIRRTYKHETVMLGDVEALLTTVLSEYDISPAITTPSGKSTVEIRWTKDEMAYWLVGEEYIYNIEEHDPETLIEVLRAIAESI